MSAWEPNGDEEVNLRLYAALRAGLIVVTPGTTGVDLEYDITPIGEARARAMAPYWDADPDTLTEAQMIALAAELVTTPEQLA